MNASTVAFVAGGALVALGGVLLVRERQPTLLGRPRSRRKPVQNVPERKGANGEVLRGFRSDKMDINERLRMLQDLTAKSVQDPEMRRLALQVTANCEDRDEACEIKAIGKWVKENTRYTGDIAPHKLWPGGPTESVDLYQSARRTVEFGGGDCDDHSVLNATLLILNGIQAKFRVTSPYRFGKDNYTHIYTMAGTPKNDPKKWVAVDTTLPDFRVGLEYPFTKNKDVTA